MKQLVLSSALALSLASGSVLAGQPNQQDMEMIFANQGVPANAQELSQYEMVETEGEWFFIPALIGGLANMAIYAGAASTISTSGLVDMGRCKWCCYRRYTRWS